MYDLICLNRLNITEPQHIFCSMEKVKEKKASKIFLIKHKIYKSLKAYK